MSLIRNSIYYARWIVLALASLCTTACLGIVDGATAVSGFELDRYLGTWYEVARLDHRFERGLVDVQAQYSLRDDGGVRVINRGYDLEETEWSTAEGKAYFIDRSDVGRLKVSFFGPFYGAYNIVALDKDKYSFAMIVGPDTNYLWILARQPELSPTILSDLKEQAKALGFDTSQLIYPQRISTKPDRTTQ